MVKTYICTAWPSLQIGPCRFRDGVYQTDDEDVQTLIESRPSFGVQVRLMLPEEATTESAIAEESEFGINDEPEHPVRRNRARQGAVGTGNL